MFNAHINVGDNDLTDESPFPRPLWYEVTSQVQEPGAGLPRPQYGEHYPHTTFRLERFIGSAEACDPHGDSHTQDHVNSGF
jgi:hypothetical protein